MTHELLRNRNRPTDIEIRLVVAKGEGEREGRIGSLGLAVETVMYRMDKQQGPTV